MQINGNLVFNTDASGELQNVFIQRLAAAPTFTSNDKGRMYFNTTTSLYYFNDGTAWQPFATGGNASLLATYVSNIEASIGSAVNQSTGAWVTPSFPGDPILAGSTSISNALSLLSTAAYGHEDLSELGDVALGTLSSNQFLVYNSTTGMWNNHTLVLADVTNVTASPADVNVLTGTNTAGLTTSNLEILAGTTASAADLNSITGYAAQSVTPTEFGYLAGATPVTSSVQGQLNSKQPLNAGLTGIATLANGAGIGIVVQTGVNTFADRSLVAPADGFSITSPDGVAGNPTFALTNNLLALSGVTSTGFLTYLGGNAFAERSIVTGSSANIVVTNGDGTAGSPTIDLATVTQGSTGSFLKFSVDSYGRVSSNTAVTTADITALVDATYVNVTGDTMSGDLTMTGGATVTGIPTPVNSLDAANKAYVDATASSLNVHQSVQTSTTSALTATYANGTAGVGATLTGTGALVNIGGYNVSVGSRVLVQNQAAAVQNGIYTVTTLSPNWVLTRATDADNHIAGQLSPGDFVFVAEGTLANTGWVETNVGTGPEDSIVIGTDNVLYTQFSGAGTYTAGTGLQLVGGQFSVVYGAGIAPVPSGDVGINVYSSATSGLILTTDGTTRSTLASASLAILLPAGSGLVQDITGLYIPAGGVSNAQLANSSITLDVTGGNTGSISLGGTLSILGSAGQGVSTTITGSTINVTVADASISSKGVAQFNGSVFSVSTGVVTLATGGVTNAMLANSVINFAGTTGGEQSTTLGGTALSIVGGTSPITTVSSANTLTINVANATASTLGLASFNGSQFSVSSGAVSLDITLGQGGITNVASSVDAAASNDMLSWNGTKWTNVTRAAMLGTESVGELSDVSLTSPATGQSLVYSGGKFVNRPSFYVYTAGSALTSHPITHNLGQKYCNVTVVDNTDEVVIPQSIQFNDTNSLTVTFTSALQCVVVIGGINLS